MAAVVSKPVSTGTGPVGKSKDRPCEEFVPCGSVVAKPVSTGTGPVGRTADALAEFDYYSIRSRGARNAMIPRGTQRIPSDISETAA